MGDDGTVYIPRNIDVPFELRESFQDLMAFHEVLEYGWLEEMGLPKPRYRVETGSHEANQAKQIHEQVHYLELMAAKDMGVLKEYVGWRPHDHDSVDRDTILTLRFYEKIMRQP